MKKTIGFYAEDRSPCAQMRLLFGWVRQAGFDSVQVLDPDIFADVAERFPKIETDVDVALIGIHAKDQFHVDVLVCKFKNQGTPVFLVEDTHSAGHRVSDETANLVDGVIMAWNDVWYVTKMSEKYRRVVYLGVPIHWQVEYRNVTIEPDLFPEGYDPRKKLIVLAGDIDPALNNRVLSCVVGAIKSQRRDDIVLSVGFHPNEKDLLTFDDFSRREMLLKEVPTLDKGDLLTPKMISLADVTIGFGADTWTVPNAMACGRQIFYTDDKVQENLRKLGNENGRWWVAEKGGMITASDTNEDYPNLRDTIGVLLDGDSSTAKSLRARQESKFPVPSNWNEQGTELVTFLKGITERSTV